MENPISWACRGDRDRGPGIAPVYPRVAYREMDAAAPLR